MISFPVLILLAGLHLAPDHRGLWIRNVHTGEELRVQPFARRGLLRRSDAQRLSRVFRSWRTGQRRPIHPRLVAALSQVQRHFGGKRIEIVSGYRVPTHRREFSSYHHVGRAADVRIPGIENRRIFEYCRRLSKLGCGAYPNATHVHIDVRSRSSTWVDLSRDREPAAYVQNPVDWLESHP